MKPQRRGIEMIFVHASVEARFSFCGNQRSRQNLTLNFLRCEETLWYLCKELRLTHITTDTWLWDFPLIFFWALTYEVSSPQGTVMFADIGAVVLAEQKWWWVKVGASFLIGLASWNLARTMWTAKILFDCGILTKSFGLTMFVFSPQTLIILNHDCDDEWTCRIFLNKEHRSAALWSHVQSSLRLTRESLTASESLQMSRRNRDRPPVCFFDAACRMAKLLDGERRHVPSSADVCLHVTCFCGRSSQKLPGIMTRILNGVASEKFTI